MIVIVDYGMGNLGSISNMLSKIGAPSIVSADPDLIERADKLILPGVGAFDTGMVHLRASGLIPLLSRMVLERGIPVLGICLGMELLTRGSEEGACPGLGWIEGRTIRFHFDAASERLNVPHMGWNSVRVSPQARLLRDLGPGSRFYFAHSYHVVCDRADDVAAWTSYGYEFAAAVERARIMGTQFHPEKSHRYGKAVLRNFVGLD